MKKIGFKMKKKIKYLGITMAKRTFTLKYAMIFKRLITTVVG